jgi:hypothetical protein
MTTPTALHLWTLDEAAQALRVSASWLRRSDCPYVRLGARRLYDPEVCMAWARARSSHSLDGTAA